MDKLFTNKEHNVTGFSYYQDTVEASYNELVAVFGMPTKVYRKGKSPFDKVKYEWEIQIWATGTFFTIYDWKESRYTAGQRIQWHIGALSNESSEEAARFVEGLLAENFE